MPGAQTTIQDAGRPGARHLGVPLSGAVDRPSFAIANAVIGNRWDAPALECALSGPDLTFNAPTSIAIAGADMAATLNGTPVERNIAISVKAGDVLHLGGAINGLRSYIAFAGGIAANAFLGSTSTYISAGIGGVDGRALREGDTITLANLTMQSPSVLPSQLAIDPKDSVVLRATTGPEWSLFDDQIKAAFFSSGFEGSMRSDRMGIELQGPAILPPQNFSMISSPVFPGTVQIPPAGAPYLLLSDAQTVGGYARITQIIDADLHLAGQLRPGTKIWFNKVSPEMACDITAKKTALYEAWLPGFSFT